ncbi:hypothetical protein C0J52_27540 [Blattella germanica]|nr:hypothetical protein C0J52_27540 [Blattella germanica]
MGKFPILHKNEKPDPVRLGNLHEAFEFLDKYLEGQPWVAGDNLTIADLAIVVTVSSAEVFGYDVTKHANVTKWLANAKKTIPKYDEINHAACLDYKKFGPCRSVLLTANLLGVKLNLKLTDIFEGEQLTPEFLKLNPQHCLPTLNDNGFVLWEREAYQIFDNILEAQIWTVGDHLSIADIALVTTVSSAEIFGFDLSKYSNVTKWLARAKRTIPNYEELNHVGCLDYKKLYDDRPTRAAKRLTQTSSNK